MAVTSEEGKGGEEDVKGRGSGAQDETGMIRCPGASYAHPVIKPSTQLSSIIRRFFSWQNNRRLASAVDPRRTQQLLTMCQTLLIFLALNHTPRPPFQQPCLWLVILINHD